MEYRRLRKQKRYLRFVIFLGTLAFLAFAILMSPLLQISHIYVEGNVAVSDGQILQQISFATGQNMLSFNAGANRSSIEALPYIHHASVLRSFPDSIVISVTERTPVANIRLGNTNTHLLIDEFGMVLQSGGEPLDGRLVATGMVFSHFAVGEYLVVDNPAVFDNILLLSRIFSRYDFFPDIIDISDPFDITLHIGNTNIYFGGIQDADRKIQYLQAISQEFPLGVRGYIYIKDLSVRPRFGLIR